MSYKWNIANPNRTEEGDPEIVWSLSASLLSKAKQEFEGNEPEESWTCLVSDMLDGEFEKGTQDLLCTMDVYAASPSYLFRVSPARSTYRSPYYSQYSDINSARLLPIVNDMPIPSRRPIFLWRYTAQNQLQLPYTIAFERKVPP